MDKPDADMAIPAMSESPKVTVAVPVYNRERYVRDAIDSILAQTFTDFELLVIDDGSTDGSREVVQAFRDPRIRLVCNGANLGIPKTRNAAVRLARGEYLAFLDSDDTALPKRLAKQVAFLDGHPDHAAVGAWIGWMDEEGRPLGRIKRKAVSPDEIAAQRLFRSGLENSASMARTPVLRDFPHREDLGVGSDFDMWARVAGAHKLANLPEVLVRRRTHAHRTTREKTHLIKTLRMSIYASQLTVLGIEFTDADLERHFLLRRMHKMNFTPDRHYLQWADAWMVGLQSANRTVRLYPEPAFSHELGVFWFKTCLHAFAGVGWSAWRRFWASPLRRFAWPGLWKLARLNAPLPLPRVSAPMAH